ncbi:MAG: glycosyltransferase family 4 protein [Anaerolineales bacterium]
MNTNFDGSFATTFRSACRDPRFAARARLIPVPEGLDKLPRGPFNPADEWSLFRAVLRAARRENALLLFSSRGRLKPELLAAAYIGFWPARRRPAIVFYGEMYEPSPGLRHWVERIVVRLANRAIRRFVVYSEAECETFSQTWGVAREKLRACRFYRLATARNESPAQKPTAGHVFAGGNSYRDYEPLVEAARRMPAQQFVICTSRLDGRDDLPPNVRAGLVSPNEFVDLIATAAVVVVPMQMGTRRIAGMLTYLQAMWMKKPTIVSDALGARDYVRPGETGLVVDGTPAGYVQAIRYLLAPENAARVEQLCAQAHAAVRDEFTLENHVTQLLSVLDEVFVARD